MAIRMATQTMRAIGPTEDNMQPLVPLPSPTLTNPDMVLPNEVYKYPILPSPPRYVRKNRPPSPSYLQERSNYDGRTHTGNSASSAVAGNKEKRGLMSRKMMLLRSRTASNGYGAKSVGAVSSNQDSGYASSPTLMDVGNLAPEEPVSRWSSNDESSADSDDMDGLPQFLAKYEANNISATEDELESSPAVERYEYASGSSEAERIEKEKSEQNSAILSKRAEQILANAKQRLNLMEGNLRGARDLVAPLTAANLKRATSVASYVPPMGNFGGINRYVEGGYSYNAATQRSYRTLHAQASSPVMSRDYHNHWRGSSETKIPERPSTALERTESPIIAQGYIPTKASDPAWTKALKGSRSHDSLGNLAFRNHGSHDPFYVRGSPDPNLEPVAEDDGPVYAEAPGSTSSRGDFRDDARRYQGASTPEDLHEQMSSLKGRISALKERAREDNLRRQSMQNLREPSPLNNAVINAPELFYASSPTYGGPVLDTKAGIGHVSQSSNNNTPQSEQKFWEPSQVLTGSRNAFAEQAQRQFQVQSGSDESGHAEKRKSRRRGPRGAFGHKRTPSGTAIVQSSKHRYSHHQYYHVHDMQATYGADEALPRSVPEQIGTAHDGSSRYGDDEDSEVAASVYEEAQSEQAPAVVAHEDREDAFDYENFFLHSAMAVYGDDARRASTSSQDSVDSAETARGPTAAVDDLDGNFDAESEEYPPGTPETPEKLREIERNLHKRTFSDESVSTMATFATATEGRESPPPIIPKAASAMNWPSPPSQDNSRPSTAIPAKQRSIGRRDSSSERADSGVSVNGSRDSSKRPQTSALSHKTSLSSGATATNIPFSPPTSPRMVHSQDSATVAVNALLDPSGRNLGLRDKVLVFGLVESLKKACRGLQSGDEASQDSKMLRKRLEQAQRVLASGEEVRPGTS